MVYRYFASAGFFPFQDRAAAAIAPAFIVHQTVGREAERKLFRVFRLFRGEINSHGCGDA
jgi:hypothetical protein